MDELEKWLFFDLKNWKLRNSRKTRQENELDTYERKNVAAINWAIRATTLLLHG